MFPSRCFLTSTLFPITLSLLVGGCGQGTPKPSVANGSDGFRKYRQQSCEFGWTDGGSVDEVAAAQASIETTLFGKRFNRAALQAIDGASARDTVEFIERSQAAHVYFVPKSVSDCNLFDHVTPAPTDLSDFWDDTTRDEAADSFTVGMYLPQGSKGLSTTQSAGAISLRRDANRWHLVHEYMHHLFGVQAVADGFDGNALDASLDGIGRRFTSAASTYDAFKSQTTYGEYVAALDALFQAYRQVALHYALEEVTIETLLQKEHASGRLTYAPFDEESSDAYIRASGEKVLDQLDAFRDETRKARIEALTRGFDDAPELATILSQADDLAGQTRAALHERGLVTAILRVLTAPQPKPADAPVPCAHAREGERAMDDLVGALAGL
jgi:hypothetical protein